MAANVFPRQTTALEPVSRPIRIRSLVSASTKSWLIPPPRAVWRSPNGGKSWQKLAKGMPKKDSYFTVLRDAMTVDQLKSPALYFGTTTGQLWLGRDGGEEWSCLFDALPPINGVKVAVV